MQKKILYICGSLNQTTQMHQIAAQLPQYDHYFTPYYADGVLEWVRKSRMLEFTILGEKLRARAMEYFRQHNLQVDDGGNAHEYDLVLTCSDLIIPQNIHGKKIILVQEGMTDPEGFAYYMVKYLKLPRYLASTSTTGLSNRYDYFCVASEGYKSLFIRKGADARKLIVTGIPNFDNCNEFHNNTFPHKGYVLVATSDSRETLRYENRRKFIKNALEIADGRQIIFKLHPNEIVKRATREIRELAPGALVYHSGNINHMIANCDALVTKFSTVVYIGLALGKEVYSEFEMSQLRELVPIQNNGTSSQCIARVCEDHMEGRLPVIQVQKVFDMERIKRKVAAMPVFAKTFNRAALRRQLMAARYQRKTLRRVTPHR